eukprot:Em0001g650a
MGDGDEVGMGDGDEVGMGDGDEVGMGDGDEVGMGDGDEVGMGDGDEVGMGDGDEVGRGGRDEVEMRTTVLVLQDITNILQQCPFQIPVSEAALKSFHTILVAPPPLRVRSTTVVKSSPPPSDQGEGPHEVTPTTSSLAMEQLLWEKAWRAWHMIGIECVCKRLPPLEKFRVFLNRTPQTKDESDSFFSSVPSQAILIYLVQLFPPIYARVRSKFTGTDFQEAAKILYTSLIMPVSKDTSPFLVPSHNEHMLNSLQKDILKSMASFFTKEDVFDHEDGGPQTLFGKKTELVDTNRRVELLGEGSATPLFPLVIAELLRYGHLATTPPEMVGVYQGMPRPPIMAVNYVPFSVSATGLVVVLYCSSVEGGAVPISSSLTADCLKVSGSQLHVF